SMVWVIYNVSRTHRPGEFMDNHEEPRISFVSGLVLGAVIGAGIALLTAPQPGRRTRRRIQRKAIGIRENAGYRWDDLADEVRDRVDETLRGARSKLGA